MDDDASYARLLRPVGQALDEIGMESFHLLIEGDDIVVRSRLPANTQEATPAASLKGLWRRLSGSQNAGAPGPFTAAELRYTPADIGRLEAQGQSKRRWPEAVAEAHSLSQILRAAGGFVDQKNGRLTSVRKEGPNITFEYESTSKRIVTEQFTVSGLYDFWVRMYLKRGGRPAPRY